MPQMSGRFRREVYPGDDLRVRIWREQTQITYAVDAPARNALVMTGTATLKEATPLIDQRAGDTQ